MKTNLQLIAATLLCALATSPALGPNVQAQNTAPAGGTAYKFQGGFPTPKTSRRIYDEADLNRAVQAYRFFFPNISIAGMMAGFEAIGAVDNKAFLVLEGRPNGVLFTPNSDTPYAWIPLDLKAGPIMVELPAGPLIGAANDLNFRWVIDMGLPGPDAGKGGKHIILPPGWKGTVPTGYYTGQSTTNHIFLIIRSLPVGGDLNGALARFPTVKIRPLNPPAGWTPPTWTNVTEKNYDATPLKWETNIQFWEQLHKIIDSEPAYDAYRNFYGELAVLGIVKGKPFAPDDRLKHILEQAARVGNAQ